MATKNELETKVAELEAKLASSTPEGMLTQEQLQVAIDQVKKQDGDKIAELLADKESLAKELQSVSLERDEAVGKLLKAVTTVPASSHSAQEGVVILDGTTFKVVRKERMKDMTLEYKMRHIDDNDVCLLVKKV